MGNLLVPLKKFLGNKNTITILAVLIGIVVLYFGYTWRVNQAISPTQVPYANQIIPAGEVITDDMIGYTDVPKDMLKEMDNIVTNPKSIIDKLVKYDSKIAQNSFFFSEELMTEEEKPDSVFSNIKDGYTIFQLSVDNHSTYANSIMPDNSIDLYLRGTDETGALVFARFISSIQVLAVRDKNGRDVFANSEEDREPKELLFAVPEDLFLLLKKTDYLGDFEIIPVPRNDSYSEHAGPTKIENEYLRNLVLAQTAVVPGECTDITIC